LTSDQQPAHEGSPTKVWTRWLGEGALGASFLTVGFVARASYASSVGLGFVHAETEQLVLGAVYSIIVGCAVLAAATISASIAAALVRWVSWPTLHLRKQPLVWMARLALALAVAGGAGFFLRRVLPWPLPIAPEKIVIVSGLAWIVIHRFLAAVGKAQVGRFVWLILYGVWTLLTVPLTFLAIVKMQSLELTSEELGLGVVFAILPAVICVVYPPFRLPRPGILRTLDQPVDRPRILRKQERPLIELKAGGWLMPLACTLLVGGLTTGTIVLPHVNSSIGGAKVRHATLELRPADVDASLDKALFPNSRPGNTTVERTLQVTVILRTSDWFFIESRHMTDRSSAVMRSQPGSCKQSFGRIRSRLNAGSAFANATEVRAKATPRLLK